MVSTTLVGGYLCGVVAMLLLGGDIDDPDAPTRGVKLLGLGFGVLSVVLLVGTVVLLARRLLKRARATG